MKTHTALRRVLGGLLGTAAIAAATLAVTAADAALAPQTASAASVPGGPIAASEVLDRAQYWADQGYTYLNSSDRGTWRTGPAGSDRYRRDCSGLLSMAWNLGEGSYDTTVYEKWIGGRLTRLSGFDALRPGDAVLRVGLEKLSNHVELFSHWKDPADHAQGGYFYSFNSPGETVRTPYAASNFGNRGFHTLSSLAQNYEYAVRYDGVVDAGGAGGSGSVPTGTAADVNLDGIDDVLAKDAAGDVWAYPRTTSGSWGTRYRVGTGFDGTDGLNIADVTLDGRPDLIVRFTGNGSLRVFPHTGSTTSPYTGNGALIGTGFGGFDALNFADVTLDGRPDLAARTPGGEIRLFTHTGDAGAPYAGGGTVIGTGFTGFDAVNFADVSRDGRPDLVVRAANGDLRLFAHTGNPSAPYAGNGSLIGTGFTSFTGLLFGDMNRDGNTDLIARAANGDLKTFPHSGSTTSPYGGQGTLIGTGWAGMTDLD
ncbi:VCBS repeat-containing protein [Streptomyces sp. NPDC089919]|uniref:FG-GAP repeat domain-containing protein n=1 Tax=Streptomyces sp. NPDC089919 TaxID=3155188 RepID=UPI0034340BDB